MLAEVGYVQNKKIVPQCRLPGSKHLDFERADETMHRELSTTLAPLRDGIFLEGIKLTETKDDSKSYGLPSLYQRSVQHAKMDTDYPLPELPRAVPKDKGKIPPQFTRHFVFALLRHQAGQNRLQLYSWLQPDVFERLSSSEGKAELEHWMGALEIDEEAAVSELLWTCNAPRTKVRLDSRTSTVSQMKNTGNLDSLFKDIRSKFKVSGGLHDEQEEPDPEPQQPSRRGHRQAMVDTRPATVTKFGAIARMGTGALGGGISRQQSGRLANRKSVAVGLGAGGH